MINDTKIIHTESAMYVLPKLKQEELQWISGQCLVGERPNKVIGGRTEV